MSGKSNTWIVHWWNLIPRQVHFFDELRTYSYHRYKQQVIPTQFVLFNFSAIIGSAILYRDFNKVTFHQFMNFLYGCGATFGGVYLLTTSKTQEEERGSEEDSTRRLSVIPEEDLESGTAHALPSPPIRILKKKASRSGIGLSPGQVKDLPSHIKLINSHYHIVPATGDTSKLLCFYSPGRPGA